MRIVGILLAAGEGARFGGGKLLARVPTTAHGVSAGTADRRRVPRCTSMAALNDVVAVVRPRDAMLEHALAATGARVLACERAAEGMGASLACGVAASARRRRLDRCAGGHAVDRADEHRGGRRCDSRRRGDRVRALRGKRGHPVGFARKYGALLAALTGDEGARSVIAARQWALQLVDVDDPGVLRDVDQPSDLA